MHILATYKAILSPERAGFNPNNLGFLCIFAQKYIHVYIFHNNDTAMMTSQLFLTHMLTVILCI